MGNKVKREFEQGSSQPITNFFRKKELNQTILQKERAKTKVLKIFKISKKELLYGWKIELNRLWAVGLNLWKLVFISIEFLGGNRHVKVFKFLFKPILNMVDNGA